MDLDSTKIAWYIERVQAWERGERIAPITIDMALTTACNYKCVFCYGKLQSNTQHQIKREHLSSFLKDASDIGVKGVSLVSDGESTLSPLFAYALKRGNEVGLSMAVGTNAYLLTKEKLLEVLPLTKYLRVNISAGEEARYQEIMGSPAGAFKQVCSNIEAMVKLKREGKTGCTIGMQMVFLPSFADQVLPLTRLAISLGVDYLIIKHCSDDELGTLGVNYDEYQAFHDLFRQAEGYSTAQTSIQIRWSKIRDGNQRSYGRCYAAPFMLQFSGTGLVAPCGMLFHERYSRYHMGNITQQSFREIWESPRYWRIIRQMEESFNPKRQCGYLCLQHNLNCALWEHVQGTQVLVKPEGSPPPHLEFV